MAVQEEPHQLHGSAEIRVATRVLQIAKYIVTSLKAQRGWSNPALHEREAASVSHEAQPELMRGTFENHHMDTDWKLSKQDHRYRKHNSDAYRVRKACPKKSSVMTKSKVSRINKIEWEDWTQDIDAQMCCFPQGPLTNTTVDGSLFASGQVNPDWSSLTWVELARLLVFIYDALATLQMNLGSNDRLVSSGDEVVHSHNVHADLSYVAKMEYLLLHYRDSMIEALIRKTVELVASMRWQKLQRSLRQELDWQCRRSVGWFSEYPNNQRPKCTTWPWSIKPSLAVLWGVCWMFFDRPYEQFTYSDPAPAQLVHLNPAVPIGRIFQQSDELRNWPPPQTNAYLNYGRQILGVSSSEPEYSEYSEDGRHRGVGWQIPDENWMRRGTATSPSTPTPTTPISYLPRRQESEQYHGQDNTAGGTHNHNDRLQNRAGGRHVRATATAINVSPTHYKSNASTRLSHNNSHLSGSFDHLPSNDIINASSPGHLATEPLTLLHHQAANPNVPELRVNDFEDIYEPFSPPEPFHRPLNSYNSPRDFTYNTSPFQPEMGDTQEQYQQQQHIMNAHAPLQPSNSQQNILSPVSIAMDPEQKAAQTYIERPESRSKDSEHSGSENADGIDYFPRRNHAYKRPEDPPRNAQGRMVCKFADNSKECTNLVFDRKCEWSKHMDKHDRPYKCNARGCEKLRGFTYSGGLLRHEREVHKMHGGTKKSLYCPHADCKRSSGSGFTRKENLAEHIRRVHRTSSGGTDVGNTTQLGEDSVLESTMVHSPDNAQWDGQNGDPAMDGVDPQLKALDTEQARKRKRMSATATDVDVVGVAESEDLREVIRKLKLENQQKDERLRKLEETVASLQSRP